MNSKNPGELVLVATPIGNLGDISERALTLLRDADVVYCEDTRRSRVLFSAKGISSSGRLRALHEHNEVAQSADVIERVAQGQCVALISDAGTPGISDPGSRVVAAVVAAGFRVSTIPGPSAVIAAITISGLASDRFIMEGFLSRKAGERHTRYDEWTHEVRTVVFYESPQRLRVTLDELATRFPQRRAAVVREVTKLHEEVLRGTLDELSQLYSSTEILGEIVVVLAGAEPAPAVSSAAIELALEAALAAGASLRDAVSHVVSELNVAHRDAYELALVLREGRR